MRTHLNGLSAIDIKKYINEVVNAEDSQQLLDIFSTTLKKLGFTDCEFDFSHGFDGKSADPGPVGSTQFKTDLVNPGAGSQNRFRCLLNISATQNGAFYFRYCPDSQAYLPASDEINGSVCIPLRGAYGFIALVSANNNGAQKVKPASTLENLDAVTAVFYKKYCSLSLLDVDQVPLTSRELEVLRLVSEGQTKRSVADCLNVSNHAVDFHFRNIMKKYNTKKIVVAVVRAVRAGLI